ncbi:hypothetical protein [Tunturiibacter psychrotolerans]|uniref:hypothetical protein n=1 Tax=Tunturiibacter psychrotolerans TaxID=3069686 RepID=UPI003D1EF9B6
MPPPDTVPSTTPQLLQVSTVGIGGVGLVLGTMLNGWLTMHHFPSDSGAVLVPTAFVSAQKLFQMGVPAYTRWRDRKTLLTLMDELLKEMITNRFNGPERRDLTIARTRLKYDRKASLEDSWQIFQRAEAAHLAYLQSEQYEVSQLPD